LRHGLARFLCDRRFSIGISKLAQGNCGHTAVADVEKYTGGSAPVAVFYAPNSA
jgi:trimethylamine-N-oxide reductase (cytochrome c)